MIKQRKPIPRISEKRSRSGKPFLKRSAIKRSTKKIRSVNPKAKAKRVIGYRKMLASKEYKAARAEAMERAGGRCEHTWFDYEAKNFIDCYETESLHAHHLRYPKTRPLAATDLLIVCKRHHEMLESRKLHKARMF